MQLKNQNNQSLISQAMDLKRKIESSGMTGEQYLSQLLSEGKVNKKQVENAMNLANMILGKK